MRKIFFSIALMMIPLLFLCFPAAAEQTAEVEALLESKIEEVLSVLGSADLPEKKKKERIMSIISPVIDFDLMARLSLGRQNWNALDNEQQERFVELFVNRLKDSYLDKTTFYSDQKVAYDKAVSDKDKVFIPTRIVTEDKPVSVIYKFYSASSSWRVYDIEIEGVSFIRSYRSQFNEVLRDGGVEDLFDLLREPDDEDPLP